MAKKYAAQRSLVALRTRTSARAKDIYVRRFDGLHLLIDQSIYNNNFSSVSRCKKVNCVLTVALLLLAESCVCAWDISSDICESSHTDISLGDAMNMSSFRNYGRHSMNLAVSMEQDRLQGWLNVANVDSGEILLYT